MQIQKIKLSENDLQLWPEQLKGYKDLKCATHSNHLSSVRLAESLCPFCVFALLSQCQLNIRDCSNPLNFNHILQNFKIELSPALLQEHHDIQVNLREFALECFHSINKTITFKIHQFYFACNPEFKGFDLPNTVGTKLFDPVLMFGTKSINLSKLYPTLKDIGLMVGQHTKIEDIQETLTPYADKFQLQPPQSTTPFCNFHKSITPSKNGLVYPCPACFLNEIYSAWAFEYYTLTTMRLPKIKSKNGPDICLRQADNFNASLKIAIKNEYIKKTKVQIALALFKDYFPDFVERFDFTLPPNPRILDE